MTSYRSLVVALAASSFARVLHLPIHGDLGKPQQLLRQAETSKGRSSVQTPGILRAPPDSGVQEFAKGPAYRTPTTDRSLYNMYQTINVTIGTPPQTFRLMLDINSRDLLVGTAACNTSLYNSFCQDADALYNASASSSFSSENRPVKVPFQSLQFEGDVARETVSVAGVILEEQPFLPASNVSEDEFALYDYDGGFGLGRIPPGCPRWQPGEGSHIGEADFWTRLQDLGMIEDKLFGMKLGQLDGSPGELTLGGINTELFQGEMHTFPISNVSSDFERCVLQGGWHVDMGNISVGDVEYNLSGTHAVFSTDDPFIWLPYDVGWDFLEQLGIDTIWFIWPFVDCNSRASLPDFLIELGPERHVFALSAWDYIIEWRVQDEHGGAQVLCYAPFWPLESSETDGYNVVRLGTAFLKSFYSVFDADRETVSLAYLREPQYGLLPPRRQYDEV